ncbi:MAG: hypothetical protein ABI401_02470 [Candidatus Dormibacter sp.]
MGDPPCFAHLLDDEGRMPDPAEWLNDAIGSVEVARPSNIVHEGVLSARESSSPPPAAARAPGA